MRADPDAPAATPAERRDQVERELSNLREGGLRIADLICRGRALTRPARPRRPTT